MMATYYSIGGSEIQAAAGPDSSNNLQTLYLMNPTFSGGRGGRGTGYNHHPSSSSSSHDRQQQHHQLPTNMFLLNSHDPSIVTSSSSSSPFTHTLHQQHHHHHLVGIPLATQSPHHHQDDHRPSPSSSSGGAAAAGTALNIHELPPTSLHGFLPRVHCNLWNAAATAATQLDPSSSSSPHHIPTAIAMTTSGDGFRRPPPLTIQQHYQQQQQQQGLSLSLNNNNNNSPNTNNKITTFVHDPVGGSGHHQTVSGMGLVPHHMGTIIPGDNSSTGPPAAAASPSCMTNVVGGVGSLVLGSKYLKVAQELLDEVVNVESGVVVNDKVVVDSNQKDKLVVMGIEGGETSAGGGGGGVSQQQQELSTTQRQELQMKKAKLLNMLDEVEQRYRQYHTQMQIIVTSFEQTAGIGSARSYTALALQTISKQFRCLKDAITSQIKATSKTLGEDDGCYNNSKRGAGDGTPTTTTTRLRFVDHQLRQQRALQQLGMVQHNAWRPQRGLPERAVSVLRAWLFEHFLHPYPKDSDKHMLAKQTGLTRSQVSNWFINARVRLWKPMVEEMYLEEVKAQEQNSATTNHHRVNDQNNNPVTVATGANTTNNNEHLDNNDHDSSSAINTRSSSSNPIHNHHTHSQPQVEKSTHILNHTNTLNDHHNIPNPPTIMSSPTQLGHHLHHQSGGTTVLQNFSLMGTSSSDMESILFRSPKRQRSIDIHHNNNSPTSIISMEMEMKPGGNQDHQPTQNHLFMTPTPAGGFGPFPTMGEIGSRSSFDPSEQQQLAAHQFMHGNGGVSLTLGLPHGENQLSPHHHHQQHNFIPTQNMQLAGRRVVDHHQIEQVGDHHHHRAAAAAAAAEFCGITNSTQQQPSGTAGAYDGIDLQNRKRFAAAQLLPDFVIQQ